MGYIYPVRKSFNLRGSSDCNYYMYALLSLRDSKNIKAGGMNCSNTFLSRTVSMSFIFAPNIGQLRDKSNLPVPFYLYPVRKKWGQYQTECRWQLIAFRVDEEWGIVQLHSLISSMTWLTWLSILYHPPYHHPTLLLRHPKDLDLISFFLFSNICSGKSTKISLIDVFQ